MHSTRVSRRVVSLALVFLLGHVGCGGLDGPAAPSGARLSGEWVSDVIRFDVPGGSPEFVIRFVVADDNRTVSDVSWRYSDNSFGNGWPGTATIENGRLRFDQEYEGTCNGVRKRLTLEVLFRNESEGDGEWRSVAIAPPGHTYCGAASGRFKPRRR
jgi:hypothetical protein